MVAKILKKLYRRILPDSSGCCPRPTGRILGQCFFLAPYPPGSKQVLAIVDVLNEVGFGI